MKWFSQRGWIFLPSPVIGWALTTAFAALAVGNFLQVDGGSHSMSDTLYGIFPLSVILFVLWYWLATNRS